MDFVTHLPRTPQGHDAVWVIVDRLTKSAHFLAVRMTFTLERFYRLYIREIVQLHGVLVSIVLDRDPRFTAHFGKSFQKAMGTRLTMSTAFHPQTDGQSERTILVLEDMLLACVLDHKCDAPKPGCSLTTHQPAEYSWMSGNPTPLMKIGQSLLCTGSSTQGTNLSQQVYNDHIGSTCE